MTNRPTIKEIVTSNVEEAKDQRHEFDSSEDYYEGDSYLQNVQDTLEDHGYDSDRDWENARGLFMSLARKEKLRFTLR